MLLKDLVPWHTRTPGQKRDTAHPALTLQDEVNRLFESFFQGVPSVGKLGEFSFTPNVDVLDNETEIVITAELPGIDENDIDITLNRDRLVLKGEKKREEEHKENDVTYVERSYGSFQRVIPLPVEIDEDQVDASFDKGVLCIRLPKSTEAKERVKKVSVRT